MSVREAGLQALLAAQLVLPSSGEIGERLTRRVWVTCHDPEEEVKGLAQRSVLAGVKGQNTGSAKYGVLSYIFIPKYNPYGAYNDLS